MYTPRHGIGGQPRTPKSGFNLAPSGPRRTSLLAQLGTSGSRRTPVNPRLSMAPMTPQNMSGSFLQSSFVLEETPNHNVEAFGTTLPVTVAEILTMSEKPAEVTVSVSPNGWAWLVNGRRLVVWRYSKVNNTSKWAGVNCRELTLPPSDLSHSSKLINIFSANESQTPSCIAVSPEGIIRYWPSIAHEGSSYEVSAELQGQECFTLTDIQPIGSILSTTTATVVLVNLENVNGQHTIVCRQLKTPQGFLSGIGRRVSSILWGGVPSATSSDARLIQVLTGPTEPLSSGASRDNPFEKYVFVLTSMGSFQKWKLAQGEPEQMIYSCEIEAMAKQAFCTKTWGPAKPDPSWSRFFPLDMQHTSDGMMILLAACHPNVQNHVFYALATLKTKTDSPPTRFSKFYSLKYTTVIPENLEFGQISPPRLNFLLPSASSHQIAYVFNNEMILSFQMSQEGEDPEQLDFANNYILGTGSSADGKPLFFTLVHGLISFSPNNIPEVDKSASILNESSVAAQTTLRLSDSLNISISQAGIDNLTMSDSKKDKLKAAFLLYCKRDFNHAAAIVDDLFPVATITGDDSPMLDRLVVSMSTDLINDFPASDPRWLESIPASEAAVLTGVGSSTSLLILHQLQDKQTALEVFINFLREVNLWQRFTSVECRELLMATTLIIGEHVEKIFVAIALHNLQAEYPDLIEKAIIEALKLRPPTEVSSIRHLTPQDHFYRQISKVEDFIEGLQMVEQDVFVSNRQPTEIVTTVHNVNKIILTIFRECLKFRQRETSKFVPRPEIAARCEYQSWTSSPGPKGLRSLLLRQYNLTIERTVGIAEDGCARGLLFQQLVDLCDFILDGYCSQIATIPKDDRKKVVIKKQYETDRTLLIMPLVKHDHLEEAASLAEKYFEFNALVKICELRNDMARLDIYMDQFADQDFSNFVFNWHVKEGKQSKLLAQPYSSKRQERLGQFLENHTGISWLHDLKIGSYAKASRTLFSLAGEEFKTVEKKKTLLSLSKLSALAAGSDAEGVNDFLANLDEEMNIIVLQDQLPDEVLDEFALDRKLMRVLSPRELIELYTSDQNKSADALDFKKALELLDRLPTVGGTPEELLEEKEKLKIKIWAKSILRNPWTKMDTKDPLTSICDTVFFRLVDFCYTSGMNPLTDIPTAEQLFSSDELSSLQADPNFKFLIKTAFEYIERHGMA